MGTLETIDLLIIDPQNDFCDFPGSALPVAGADADMQRLAAIIDRVGGRLRNIHVTLDSHQPLDIAHPAWWVDARGEAPPPFTPISVADVRDGLWHARDPRQQTKSQAYVEALAAEGRYTLVVWPEHCLIGSPGHNVHRTVKEALDRWARAQLKTVDFVIKGTNPATEHYSALRAEVPDPDDPGSQLNTRLLAALADAERVLVAGEALSHCVASTLRDVAAHLPPAALGRFVLLTDCTSPVGGFEALGADFLAEMSARGLRTARSVDILN